MSKTIKLTNSPVLYAFLVFGQVFLIVGAMAFAKSLLGVDGITNAILNLFVYLLPVSVIAYHSKKKIASGFTLGISKEDHSYTFKLAFFMFIAAFAGLISAIVQKLPVSNFFVALFGAIISGFFEELLIRGVITNNMMRCWKGKVSGIYKSVFLPALMVTIIYFFFGSKGGSLLLISVECLCTFTFSALLSAIFLRTKDLIGLIITHSIFNFVILLFINEFAPLGLSIMRLIPPYIGLIFSVISLIITIYLLRAEKHKSILLHWVDTFFEVEEYDQDKQALLTFFQYLPELVQYHFISFVLMQVLLAITKRVSLLLISTTNRSAITSGDFKFLLTSPQGWLVIIIFITVFAIAIAIDINGMLILSSNLIHNKKYKITDILKEGFLSLRLFLNKEGIIIALFVSLFAPIVGFGLKLQVTKKFYIPNFITSVIYSTPIYLALYAVVILALTFFSIRNIFLIPYMILENKTPKECLKEAHHMIRERWVRFIPHMLFFSLKITVLLSFLNALFTVVPDLILTYVGAQDSMMRYLNVLFYLINTVIVQLLIFIQSPIYIIEFTRLFYSYKDNKFIYLDKKRKHLFTLRWTGIAGLILLLIIPVSIVMYVGFDDFFPAKRNVQIIAHRLGGNEAPENSIMGEEYAFSKEVYGVETDIQRTLDGYYVINHDNDFSRLCLEYRHVKEMTLEEVKQLRYADSNGNEASVATLEEVLDAGKDKGQLFLELKGESADMQMADDVIKMIEERDMVEQCTIISLDYSLISYIYDNYDDIETGYLYYFSYGDTANLKCDLLIMEEESATPTMIDAIHNAGKKAVVWTVNS
ncbi:MAG: glycerophosphoryl diester phosphodiesterase membrane domain-containing protein, partial [Erysipelotrichaceae bacterium]|nr:glycerophosphoryl diester phosphodiesterase membrane domain-containing protein [Erysipelotrichaceae bacterium]